MTTEILITTYYNTKIIKLKVLLKTNIDVTVGLKLKIIRVTPIKIVIKIKTPIKYS